MNDVKLADYFNNPELFVGQKTIFFGKIGESQNYDHEGLIGKIFTIELDSEKSEAQTNEQIEIIVEDSNDFTEEVDTFQQLNKIVQFDSSVIQNLQGGLQDSISQDSYSSTESQSDESHIRAFTDYDVLEELHGGTFGRIFHVKHRETSQYFAIKKLPYTEEDDKKRADDEVELLKQAQSKYTVKFEESFVDGVDLCIVMKFYKEGNLRKLFELMKTWPYQEREKRMKSIFFHVLSALALLHSKDIVHRDLKPENILIGKRGKAKTGDYGLSKKMEKQSFLSTVGTKEYRPFEAFDEVEKKMTKESDIWALGVIVIEGLIGKHPFQGIIQGEIVENIKSGRMQQIPDYVPKQLKDMLLRMVHVDPTRRPSAQDLLDSEIMKMQSGKEDDEEKEIHLEKLRLILESVIQDLRLPYIGTRQQKQQVHQKQEESCRRLINNLENKEDDEFRGLTLEIGVVDALLHIFLTRRLETITPEYINAFLWLTLTNNEIRQLIYLKNPYPALIRLFEHPNEYVVGNAIASIFNIQLCGFNTTSATEQHPHYEAIAANQGIEKIFNLFQHNVSKYNKDCAAICLGHLFKCREITNELMRREIINHLITLLTDVDSWTKKAAKVALNQLSRNKNNLTEILRTNFLAIITNELRKELEGTEEQIEQIQENQENLCNLLIGILKNREDNELRRQIIESGIVDALLHIFLTRRLETITPEYTNAFFKLIVPCSNEIRQQIYLKNPYPALIRLLSHSDEEIVNNSFGSIYNIQLCGFDTTLSTEQHPHYEEIAANQGIEKIFNLFQRNVSKYSKVRAAIILGHLFRC
ncbi:MAG: putative CAMK family protein kinase, partial [Streblomastix strix]